MTKMKNTRLPLGLALALGCSFVVSGPVDPDCTAEKAAKSTAMKATVGVSGRCSPAEAAKDTAARKTGLDDRKDNDKDRDGKMADKNRKN